MERPSWSLLDLEVVLNDLAASMDLGSSFTCSPSSQL